MTIAAVALAACGGHAKTPDAALGPAFGPPQPAQTATLPADAAIVCSSMRWQPARTGFVNWELYAMNERGEATRLGLAGHSHQHAAVAPDHRHVAVSRTPSEPAKRLELWWIDLAERTERQVAPAFFTAGAGGVDVSSDGFLYFAGEPREKDGNDLFRVRVGGSQIERLSDTPAPEFDVSVSDDGAKIAFVRVAGFLFWVKTEVWVANADGSGAVRVFDGGDRRGRQGPFPFGGYDPEFSPDGRKLVFSRTNRAHDNFGLGAHDLWIAAADGSSLRRLTDPGPVSMIPDWRADGTILFTSFDERRGYVGLAKTTASGGAVQPIEPDLAQLWDGCRHGKWIPPFDPTWPHERRRTDSID